MVHELEDKGDYRILRSAAEYNRMREEAIFYKVFLEKVDKVRRDIENGVIPEEKGSRRIVGYCGTFLQMIDSINPDIVGVELNGVSVFRERVATDRIPPGKKTVDEESMRDYIDKITNKTG